MADVAISLGELREMSRQIGSIVREFEESENRSEALEEAIGDPYGRSELRSEASEFEGRWDDKRSELKDALEEVREHVDGVIDGFEEWDAETAIALEVEDGTMSQVTKQGGQ